MAPSQAKGKRMSDISDLGSFDTFVAIIARLRAPDGCPWDREQTHASLRPFLLEEAHEALDVIDRDDLGKLPEELGDILLQVGLHAQIGKDSGKFSMEDVLRAINAKLIRRHPHVFGGTAVSSAKEVEANWDKLKKAERAPTASALDGIPAGLPALAQSQSIQGRAARAGFDWPDMRGVLDKVREEIGEFEQAHTKQELTHELGDIFAALVNVGRKLEIDSETALREANNRFRFRYQYMEERARGLGRPLADMPLDEQEALWQEAKRHEKAVG
jgi:tetrapyrrole methylase family protein/MazG family protein